MTPRPLAVLGGGEHARVVIEAARSRPDHWRVVGVVDLASVVRTLELLRVDHLGDDDAFVARYGALPEDERPWLVIGVGGAADPAARGRLAERFARATRWATVIHAAAWVAPSAAIGEGSVVAGAAIVNAGARVGRHAVVNSGGVVEHDVVLGDFCQLAPGAIVGGGAVVGEGAFIGLGALVRDHVAVGARALVGMGAVVVADVPPDTTVVGNPARPLEAP